VSPIESTECSRLFQQLEVQRTGLLAEFSQWPAARLRFRLAPHAWSVVEVLDHIVRAESGTIADIRAGLLRPHPLGSEERPGVAALDRALRSDRAFTVPAEAPEIHPDAQATLADVAPRWEKARAELAAILATLAPDATRCGVFQHPFAGWMTVAEVLEHLHAHLYHHQFQLARLRLSSEALQP